MALMGQLQRAIATTCGKIDAIIEDVRTDGLRAPGELDVTDNPVLEKWGIHGKIRFDVTLRIGMKIKLDPEPRPRS